MGYISVKYMLCFTFVIVFGKEIDTVCDLRNIPSGCSKSDTCTPDSNGIGRCKCAAGEKRNADGICTQESGTATLPHNGGTAAPRILPHDEGDNITTSGSSVAAGILIPVVVIACVVLVVFLARRYRWPQRLRQLRARHYDEMQIGQDDDDDPPIA